MHEVAKVLVAKTLAVGNGLALDQGPPSHDDGKLPDPTQLQDFHCVIVEHRQPAATGLDGLRVVPVTLALIASAGEGRTVKIEPLTA